VTAATTSSGRSTRSTSSPESEPSGLADFVRFCAALRLAGKPFILEPFQRTILRDYFAGTTQTLAIIPKKNGKSTLVAALALYHLLVTEDAEGYIAASSRDQAAIILKQARKFIRATPALQRHLGMKQREIVNLGDEGLSG
jgi:phage terminase large subunit-like protein